MPPLTPAYTPLLLFVSTITQSTSFQLPLRKNSINTNLAAKQTYIYDGGELQSFLLSNPNNAASTDKQVGCVTFVTAQNQIGILADSTDNNDISNTLTQIQNYNVYTETIANIPPGISEYDAISTAAAALVGVHCGVPKVTGVGGGEVGFYSGKAVVMGGNEYACFLAEGLAALGIDTSLVSTGSVKLKNTQVKTLRPAVTIDDEEEIGFTTALGQFDSLIDTLANERKGGLDASSVIQLLASRHQCTTYISTLSKSQQIIKKDGVIFGPGKANSHIKSLEGVSNQCMSLLPSPGFGPMTLQVLLDNKIIYPSKSTAGVVTRGWSMKDFWEETSWPRDSNGSGVRYGLPTVEEEDLDALFQRERISIQRRVGRMEEEEEDDGAVAVQDRVEENPYVTQIIGMEGLAENVINTRKDCVVFVAMRSCRTCKSINPVFTKIAREYDGDLMFAKADATGKVGKALGKSLGLVSVPSFVLFRGGVRYGAVQTSKLPSDRLEKAIADLESGRDFDPSCEEGDD